MSGDCKRESGQEHVKIIETVLKGVNVLQDKTKLRIVSVASDGETQRGSAFILLTFKTPLLQNSPIYPILSPLKFLNLHVGDDDCAVPAADQWRGGKERGLWDSDQEGVQEQGKLGRHQQFWRQSVPDFFDPIPAVSCAIGNIFPRQPRHPQVDFVFANSVRSTRNFDFHFPKEPAVNQVCARIGAKEE